eukprot:gene55719-74400_t
MFEGLSKRLGDVFDKLRGRGALSEADVDAALREVRTALLEADVALSVVRQFIDEVRPKAIGADVIRSVTPGQMVIKIVHDELVETLGGMEVEGLKLDAKPPVVIMMVGLQGSDRQAYEIEIGEAAARGTRGLLTGSLDNVSITTNYNDGRYINKNVIGSFGFDYEGDTGGIKAILGYTRTKNTTDLPLIQSSIRSISVDYDRTADARFPTVRLFRTISTGGVFSRGA